MEFGLRNVERHPKSLLAVCLLTCAVGAGVGLLGTWQTLAIQTGGSPGPNFFCGITRWLDCYGAHASRHAVVANQPVAWLGVLYCVWIGLTVAWALARPRNARAALSAAFTVSVAAVAYSVLKAGQLVFEVQRVCPTCVVLYLVNIAIFLCLGRSLDVSWRGTVSFFREYARRVMGRTVSESPPRAALYFTSAVIVFSIGAGGMNVWRSAQPDPDETTMAVVAHFRQPRQALAIPADAPRLGNPDGPVSVVVFSDFQCPACRLASIELRGVLAGWPQQVSLGFVNFPLDQAVNAHVKSGTHRHAGLAARAGICAQRNGRFWEYHDRLFAGQERLDRDYLLAVALALGWDPRQFSMDMESERTHRRLHEEIELAHRVGVDGTPVVFVNGRRIEAWHRLDILRSVIAEELRRSPERRTASIPRDDRSKT